MMRKWLVSALVIVCLAGCSSSPEVDGEQGVVRKRTMEEAGLSYGAQSALAYYGAKFNQVVNDSATQMDQIYNFNRFILANNILPPVIRQTRKEISTEGLESLRLADRTIQIIKPAHFVTTPPTWRDYILVNTQRPELPDEHIWPATDDEYHQWVKAVNKGWFQGKQQLTDIATQNLSLLQQDYTGIILYHELLAQNMVSEPMVGKDKLGVTGDKSKLRLNDQVLRITARSDLTTRPQDWNPVVVKGNETPTRFSSSKATGK